MSYFIGYFIGVLIAAIIFGMVTKYIAESKGYDGGFWWGFFLGIIGILVVGFRPDIKTSTYSDGPMYGGALSSGGTLSGYAPKQGWKCSNCGTFNSEHLDYCPICRKKRVEDIRCPHCGAMNNYTRVECVLCGQPLKEEKVSAESEDKNKIQQTVSSADESESTAQGAQVASKEDSPMSPNIRLLEDLARLHAQGILTDEEFTSKKKEIMAKIEPVVPGVVQSKKE